MYVRELEGRVMLSYCSVPHGSTNMESRLLEGAFPHGYNNVSGLHALARYTNPYHLSIPPSTSFTYADYAASTPPGVFTPVTSATHPAFSMDGLLSRHHHGNGTPTLNSPPDKASSPGSAHSGKSGKFLFVIVFTICSDCKLDPD